jgi:hypothetical protein
MAMRTWVRRLLDRQPRTIRKDLFRFRARLEALEDRTLLSVAVATTTNELVNDIAAANNGTGPTTILLQAADPTNGFDFTSAYQATNNALPEITANITIEGTSGYNNTIQRSTASGTPAFRLFDVASGASLDLEQLTLQGGLAHGTGTAADGGAIFSSGTLNLSGVTVQSNMAQGSNGPNGTRSHPSGGNGVSASGGGLYVAGGTVTLNNDTLSGNDAKGGNGGNGSVGGSGGSGGDATGGGLDVSQGVTVRGKNTTITNNTVTAGAGGAGGSPGGSPGPAGTASFADIAANSPGFGTYLVNNS